MAKKKAIEIDFTELQNNIAVALLNNSMKVYTEIASELLKHSLIEKRPAVEVIEKVRDYTYGKQDELSKKLKTLLGDEHEQKTQEETE